MRMQLNQGVLLMALISASLVGYPAYADQPKISYLGSKSTFYDGSYKIYTVECENGKKAKISFWESAKHWCVGVDQSECNASKRNVVRKVCR